MSTTVLRAAEARVPSPVRLTLGVAAVSLLVTVLVLVLPFVRFAYTAPALRAVLETVNAMIAFLVAYLVALRYRESCRLQELLLVAGLVLVAVANLLLTALPAALVGQGPHAAQWDSLVVRLLGSVLLAVAALVPDRLTPPAGQGGRRRVLVVGGAFLVGLVVLRAVFIETLPPPVEVDVAAEQSGEPLVTGHPLVLSAQVVGLLLYAVAAVAFTRQAARTRDALLPWLAAHCVLSGTARLHYLLFPSLYSDYVYTGDLLRLAAYVLLLVGASGEIRGHWARAAVLEDRRRLARDLHDGLTQELSYIYGQALRLEAHPDDRRVPQLISGAAGRALDEARHAIGALTRPVDQAFGVALQQTVEDLGRRHDVRTETAIERSTVVPPEQAEVLLRVTAEALRNAVRHGGARCVTVSLTQDPLELVVRDDGRGFDPDEVVSRGFGLTSMRERAEGAGARYALRSRPGEGTTVRVSWS
jgi:signal transduction histidine kinase